MAHECFSCGSECYCSGDIDDVIVSLTPATCRSCGCEDEAGRWDDNEGSDDDEDYGEYYLDDPQ